jgi:hypothetical protein
MPDAPKAALWIKRERIAASLSPEVRERVERQAYLRMIAHASPDRRHGPRLDGLSKLRAGEAEL